MAASGVAVMRRHRVGRGHENGRSRRRVDARDVAVHARAGRVARDVPDHARVADLLLLRGDLARGGLLPEGGALITLHDAISVSRPEGHVVTRRTAAGPVSVP